MGLVTVLSEMDEAIIPDDPWDLYGQRECRSAATIDNGKGIS